MLQVSQWIFKQNAHSLASSLKIQYQWVTLSFAETKVFNHFNFHLSKCKQNKYVMNDITA